MPRKPPLHSADELISPALERTIEAVGPPDDDAALIALARVLALTIDRMSNAERRALMGQTVPALMKCLVEIDKRAARRGKPAEGDRWPSRLDQLRAARVSGRKPDFL